VCERAGEEFGGGVWVRHELWGLKSEITGCERNAACVVVNGTSPSTDTLLEKPRARRIVERRAYSVAILSPVAAVGQ
jgi:hypothetical protein